MNGPGRRESVALHEVRKPIPRHVSRGSGPPVEPFAPDSPDPLLKLLQPQAIARDAVVGKVAPQFPA